MKYLGENFDIHTGGVDHIPVHHTNEIAQAEAATGKKFVNYWLHNEFVLVDGEKMSKSKGNFFKTDDIEKRGFDILSVRYLFLTSHYRSKLNFTWESLKAAESALSTLREHVENLKEKDKIKSKKERVDVYRNEFLEKINDDLDTVNALSVVWKLLRDEKEINNKDKLKLLLEFDEVLGLKLDKIRTEEKIPDEVKELIEKRKIARKKNDWKNADEIRKELLKKYGIILEDTGKGVRWKRVR
jgi:cysteinyl-tRNA synthetase